MAISDADLVRMKEQIELLYATRGADKRPLSSVRRGELLALANRPLESSQVADVPTKAQFNALQSDVRAIFDALATISNALGNARIP